jgi:hypothetical protein
VDNKNKIARQTRHSGEESTGAKIYRLPYPEVKRNKKRSWRTFFPARKWMKKGRQISLIALTVLALLGAGAWSGKTFFNSPDVTSQTVVQEIHDLSYLTTAEAVVTTTLEGQDAYQFYNMKVPGTERFFHIDVPAKLLVGIDLTKLRPSDISIDGSNKQITVLLPRADFLQEPNIDIDKVKTFSSQEVFREKLTPEEQQHLLTRAREQIREEAAVSGVLQAAEDRAVKVLQQIYKPVGYQVNVAFK